MEPIEYVIIVSDLKGSHATPGDNLHAVALQLYEITKAMNQVSGAIGRLEPAETLVPIDSSIPMEPVPNGDRS